MAKSSKATTFAIWGYWIVLVLALIGVSAVLFKTQRPIAALIWVLAGLMLIYIFYPIYFPMDVRAVTWPPYISSCPDYLTLLRPNQCVDFVGLNSPLLNKSDPNNPPPANGGSTVIFDSSGTSAQQTARAQQYGLSWEGLN